MRTDTRPLAYHLAWLVIASLVPAAWVAAALAASAFDPAWPSGLALATGAIALAAGVYASVLIARFLRRTLDDIVSEATLLGRGRTLVRLEPTVREFAAIADALVAIAARARGARPEEAAGSGPGALAKAFRWDLATGAMTWSDAVDALLDLRPGTAPSSARLLARAHPADRPLLATWLASLARGEEAEPIDFRIVRDDGAIRGIRAHAASERDGNGVSGHFEAADADRSAPLAAHATSVADGSMLDAAAALARAVAATRERARAAGIDIVHDAAPGLERVPGDEGALDAALACLIDNAVTFTPRGGRIVLRAGWDAAGDLSIALGAVGPATVAGALVVDGLGIAGNMVELNCGARAAMSVAEARSHIEPAGGRLLIARAPGQGDTVTVVLPGRRSVRAAA